MLGFAALTPPLATPFGLLHVSPTEATVFGFVPVTQVAPVAAVTLPVPNQTSLLRSTVQ